MQARGGPCKCLKTVLMNLSRLVRARARAPLHSPHTGAHADPRRGRVTRGPVVGPTRAATADDHASLPLVSALQPRALLVPAHDLEYSRADGLQHTT